MPQMSQASYILKGGSTGVLMVHGFMGLPGEIRPIGERLAAQGCTVSGVLLARHGGRPDELVGVRWTEWAESVERAYLALETRCEQVIVLGFSLGGLLALHLAAHKQVAGVITLAAALQLQGGWQLNALAVARYVMPWFYPMRGSDFSDPALRADLTSKIGEINWDDPAVIEQLRGQIRIPTGAIYEIVRLGRHVRRELPDIDVPALILQGRRDQTVLPDSAAQINAYLGSRDKHLRWFERSDHQLPKDVEREHVQQTIVAWMAAHGWIDSPVRSKTAAESV